MKITKTDFLNKVEVEEIIDLDGEKIIEFNILGAAYHLTKIEDEDINDYYWDYGYSRWGKKTKKYTFSYLKTIDICPLSGDYYIPMPKKITNEEKHDPDLYNYKYSCGVIYNQKGFIDFTFIESIFDIIIQKNKVKS
jgi:hypothetical protein